MSISFKCHQCGKKLKAPESAAGKSSTCPGCGGTVTCPEAVYDAEVVDMAVEEPGQPAGPNPYDDLDDGKAYGVADSAPADAAGDGRRPCPMCGEMIVATAAKCRYCGEVFDSSLKKVKKTGGKKKEMKSIATLQKYLLISILLMILSYIGYIAAIVVNLPAQQPGQPPNLKGPAIAMIGVLALVLLATSLASLILSVLLSSKLYGTGGAILVFFLQFVPCVGLITLLVVNGKATSVLKEKGYTVGFLGADLSDFR
jgi:predicted RNA-binding Zn-ribbon protein involved in translation (DUF1610 family)